MFKIAANTLNKTYAKLHANTHTHTIENRLKVLLGTELKAKEREKERERQKGETEWVNGWLVKKFMVQVQTIVRVLMLSVSCGSKRMKIPCFFSSSSSPFIIILAMDHYQRLLCASHQCKVENPNWKPYRNACYCAFLSLFFFSLFNISSGSYLSVHSFYATWYECFFPHRIVTLTLTEANERVREWERQLANVFDAGKWIMLNIMW